MLDLFEYARKARNNPTIKNDHTKTAVKLFKINNTLYISFRETTSDFIDWLFNLFFCSKYGYHRGFLIKVLSIYPQLLKEIKQRKEFDKIIICGYSQGGATGAIVYERFLSLFKDKEVQAHLFAAPRAFTWFNALRKRNKLKNVKRYSINADLVTKVPFFLTGFLHIGQNIRLSSQGFFFNIAANHEPNGYEKALKEYEQNI